MAELITFGCRLNIAESEAIRAAYAGEDDLIVVNSCAVTGEAVRQARQAIRRAARAKPDARIVVTGCAADTDRAAFERMAEVTAILPNIRKIANAAHAPSFAEHARAFVGVQNGCDHSCTFCIIPQGRGPSRSAPPEEIVSRIQALVERGFAEVVLTGVDLTSYGADLDPRSTLGTLVETILRRVPALQRLRLSSLDAIEVDDRLFDLLCGEPRLMPHLHLSLQHGHDLILKRMRRRHSRAQAIRFVERLKARREVVIGADLIAGFPTEDEAMAMESVSLLDACDIRFAHVFPYSARPGTPAARMPQVDPRIARERAAELRTVAAGRRGRWLDSLKGTTQNVLIEKDGITGHAEGFARVRAIDEGAGRAGRVVPLRIAGRDGDTLLGMAA